MGSKVFCAKARDVEFATRECFKKIQILAVGLEPATNTPEQFSRSFNAAIATWTKVAADAKLKFE